MPDFEQLADPEMAKGLKLSGDQREQVEELLAARKKALEAATEEERAAIVEESDKKLAKVLTQVQYGDFVGKPVEKRLQFMFRYQQWEQVLDWFAEQAELSLVVPETPPPGTLNYIDTREYTPVEAIDLMNSVLIHSGFTLVRRNRMLMVISLANGIPEGVVPQVGLEELDKRGKFELVSVRFPIGRRTADSVTGAISPLLSPYGKVVAIAPTQEIQVTDTGKIMPLVGEIIEAMPEPATATPAVPATPEPQELQVYSVKVADPTTVVSILTQLVPTATFVLDPDTNRINANATASQHTLVASVLEKMEEEVPPEKQPVLEAYPIDAFLQAAPTTTTFSRRRRFMANGASAQLLETLEKIVPGAELTINETAGTLLALATPAEHETIKTALEKLVIERAPTETKQLQTYRLTKSDPDTTLTLLETILPDARLTVDPQTRTLVALAVPADQAVIKDTLQTLQPEKPGPDAPELQFYELPLAMPPSLLEVIQKVAPQAQVAMGDGGELLMIVGTPAEHAKIKKTIDQITKKMFVEGRNQLAIYPVTPSQRTRFEAVMSSLTAQLPGMQVITDAEPGELAVWAKPAQHEVIKEILEELKRDLPAEEKFQLVGYAITSADPASVLTMLQELFPKTKLVLDPKGSRLLAWTSPTEHESIKASLEQIEAGSPAEVQPRFEAYAVRGTDLTTGGPALVAQVQTLVPDARLTLDARNAKLIAYALPKDHELLKAALASLQREATPESEPTVEVYPLTKAEPTATLALLATLIPEAQLTPGATGDTLIARAVAADHEVIKATLEKLQPEGPDPNAPQLQFYPFERDPPASLTTILANLVPKAQITVDPEEKRLVVMATPSDHEIVRATIERFEEATPGAKPLLVIYPMRSVDSASLLTLLTSLVPKAQLTVEPMTGNLVALARAEEHEIIQDTVDQLQPETPGPNTPVLRFHALADEPPAEMATVLQGLVPKAQITVDAGNKRLMVVASAADHETIETTVAEFETNASTAPELRFHPLVRQPPAELLTVLTPLVPKAQITLDPQNKRLMAVASAEDHEIIRSAVEQFEAHTPPEEPNKLAVYQVTAAQKSRFDLLVPTLMPEMPGMTIVGQPSPDELAIWAKPTQHLVLEEIIEQLTSDGPDEEKRKLIGYPVKSVDPASVLTMLQQLYPDAQLLLDPKANRLLAWMRPEEHDSIQSSLEAIEGAAASDEQSRFEAFSVHTADAATIITTLQPLVPNARLTLDPKSKRLIVWGTPTELKIIRTAVESLSQAPTAETTPTLEVYPLKKADPQTTLTLLQGLIPGAEFTLDAVGGRLIALAVSADHEIIKSTLEKVHAGPPAEDRPRFETYPILGADVPAAAAALVATLQPLVPTARLTVDPKSKQLVAWGTPDEQEIIRTAVESMGRGGDSPETTPQLEVYPLTKADPTSTLALLTSLVPDARLNVDPQTNSVVALAIPADQQTIKATLARLEPEKPGPNTPVLRFYPLVGEPSDSLITALQGLAPQAQLTLDAEQKQVMAVAAPADHEIIQSAIDDYEARMPPEEPRKLVVYPVTSAQKTRFQAMATTLTAELPGVQVIADAEPNELAVWAKPTQHVLVADMIAQLEQDVTEEQKRQLAVYPLKSADPTAVLTMMQELYPDVKFVLEPTQKRLLAWARGEEHASIKASIEQVATDTPPEDQPRFETFPIYGADVASGAPVFVSALQSLVPNARLAVDPKNRKLIAWGTPKELAMVRKAVESMGRDGDSPSSTPQLEVYPLTKADPTSTLALLTSLVPDARLSIDPQSNSVVALATPADQATIKATLERLQPEKPGPNAPALRFYPLAKEPSDSLITVLQGLAPQAQLTLDAKRKQVMAVAAPADHEIIRSTIEEYDAGTPPEEPKKLVVYPVTSADPTAVLTMIQELYPDVKFVLDPTRKRLLAWARAGEHASIKASIEQVAGAGPVEDQPRFETFPIHGADVVAGAPAFLSALQLLVPSARLTVDPKNRKLVAWGTPEELAMVRKAVESMGRDGDSPETTPQLEVYRLTKADPTSTLTLLTSLAPDSRLNIDPQSNSLVALAIPADQATIKATLERLQPAVAGPNTPLLRFHPLMEKPSENLATVLQELAPQAQITLDVENDRVMAVAAPADHEIIRSTIEEYEAGTPPLEPRKLVVYPVTSAHKKRFQALVATLTEELPGIQVIADEEPDELAVWAKPSQHVVIAGVLEQIQREAPEGQQFRLGVYRLESVDPESALAVFERLLPDTDFIVDQKTRRLMAWTSPEEHAKIQSALEAIQSGEPGEFERELVVYPVSEATPEVAVQMLQELLPDVSFTVDAAAGTILAWGRKSDHATIAKTLERMSAQGPPELAPSAVVYTLESIDATSAMQVLRLAVPKAQVSPGPGANQFVAWARPKDHEVIRTTLENIDVETADAENARAVIYSLEGMSPTAAAYALSFLAGAIPDARFTGGAQADQIVAWATPKVQEEIADLIDQLTREPPPEKAEKVVVYSLKSISAASAVPILQTAVPGATLTPDTANPQKLTAWARPSHHEMIAGILEEIDREGDATTTSKAKVYAVEGVSATTAMTILQTTVPQARITIGTDSQQLVVWARPADHDAIRQLVEEISAAAAAQETGRAATVYTLKSLTATAAMTFLGQVTPQAQLSAGSQPDQLIAWASPKDHETIRSTLDEIDVKGTEDTQVIVYTLDNMSATGAYYVTQFLTSAVPGARFVSGTQPGQLVAWAEPEEHEEIAELIEQLTAKAPPEKAPKAVVYSLESITSTEATQVLRAAVPNATLTPDAANPQKLTVFSTPGDQETIAAILQEIDVEVPAKMVSQVKVYTVEGMTASAASIILQTEVPRARVSLGSDPQQLVVFARPADHESVRGMIDAIAAAADAEKEGRGAVVYTLDSLTSTAAMTFLQQVAPRAQLSLGSQPDQLIAWANPEDHETIRSTLDEIDVKGTEDTQVIVYTLDNMSATGAYYVTQFLTSAVPGARFVSGTQPGQLVAWAEPEEHEEIAELIEQLTAKAPPEKAPKAVVYSLESITSTEATQVLRAAVPNATLTPDAANPQKLTVFSTPGDQETIAAILQEIDVEVPAKMVSQVKVYTLDNMSATGAYYVTQFLTSAVPGARFVSGTQAGQLVAWAEPEEHEEIAELIEQLTAKAPPEKAPKAVVYSLESITSTEATQVLRAAVPNATLTPDAANPQKLTVFGTPGDQETIAAILQEIDVEVPAKMVSQVKVYTVEGMTASSASIILRTEVPQARVSLGSDPQQLVVFARPADHDAVRQMIDEIAAAAEAEMEAREAVVYTLDSLTPSTAMTFLREVTPRAQLSLGSQPDQLIGWASPEDHEAIRSMLDEIDVKGTEDTEVIVYTLDNMSATGAYYVTQFLTNAVPGARFVSGTQPGQLVAWAEPEEHEEIAELIEQLTAKAPPEKAPKAVVYNLQSITAAGANQVLAAAVPNATLTTDTTDLQKLTALAVTADHETIAGILAEIDVESPAETASSVKVYTVEGMTASAASIILRTQVPQARVSLGSDLQQLVVFARPADHDAVRQVIDEIAAASTEAEAARVAQVYTLDSLTATAAMAFLRQVVPQAQLSAGSQTDQLIAWARPADHEKIKNTLAEIDIEGPDDATVAIYTLEGMDARGAFYVTRFLQTTVPGARLVQGMDASQVVAWARPKEHEEIRLLVEQLTAKVPPEKAPKAVVYNLKSITAAGANQVLAAAVPNATLTTDTTNPQRLTALAVTADHETIAGILQEIDVESPAEMASSVEVYTIEGMTAATASIILRTQVPLARVSLGTDPQQLVVFARPADHQQIKQVVEGIAAAAAEGEAARVARVYTLDSLTATAAMAFLRQVVPQAELSAGSERDQLIAWARPADHEKIDATLTEIDVEGPDDATAVIYTLEKMDERSARFVSIFLQNAIPEARFVPGLELGQLVAWARPKDHEEIRNLVDQLTAAPAADKAPKAVVYNLTSITAASASQVLADAVPDATLATDPDDPHKITALAVAADHETIAGVLKEIDVESPAETAAKVVVYPLVGMESRRSYYAYRFIREAVPQANLTLSTDSTQLIAWARPKDHERIAELLDQVLHESPELARKTVVYTLKWMTAEKAVEVLTSVVREAELNVGDDPQKLIAFARPAEQALIAGTLEEIDVEPSPETASKAVVYTLKSVTAANAQGILQDAMPDARFNVGADPQRLIVWARPADHEMIETILQEVDVVEPAETASRAILYTLEWIAAATAIEVLEPAVPEASFTSASESNQLIAWAKPADHETIEQALEKIDVEGPPDSIVKVVAYPLVGLESRRAYYAMLFVRDAVPEATLTLNSDSTQLIAWARPKEHQRIAELVEQVLHEPPELAHQMVVYTLKWSTADNATGILAEAVRGADLRAGDDPQQLIAWARPAEHEVIQGVLEVIDVEPSAETASKAVVYTLKSITAANAQTVLEDAVPDARFNVGEEDPQRLTAWARPADHTMIDTILQEIDVAEPDEMASRAILYTLEWLPATTAIEVLQSAVPEASFTTASESNQLIAWAKPADHETIEKTLEQVDVEGPPDRIADVALYPLEGMSARRAIYALRFLIEAVPEAKLSLTSDATQVIAWARPKEHEILERLVERLLEESAKLASKAVVYNLKVATAAAAIQALGSAVPDANFSPGADENQLLAFARPGDHEKIAQILDELDREPSPETEPTAVAYTLKSASMTEAMQVLRTTVPQASLSMGAEPHQLIAWARPADHEIIEEILEKMAEKGPSDLAAKVVVYTLAETDAQTAIRFLEAAVPEAEFSMGSDPRRVIAWARPADHEVIERAVTEMSEEESPETAPRVVVYDLEATGAAAAIAVLQAAVPEAQLGVGSDPGKLIVWARPEDHEVIEAAVEQFEADSWLEGNRIISVYPIKGGDAQSLLSVLTPVLRDHAQFVVDAERNSLIVWADAKQHEMVTKTIEQFMEGLEGAEAMSSQVYRLNLADPSAALSVLQTLVPDARLALDENTQSIVVSALADDHAKIKATLDEMDREGAEGQRPVLRMHRIATGSIANVYRALALLFRQDPTVQLSVDSASDAIIAIAAPLKHGKIEELIQEIEKGVLLEADTTLVLYPMKNVDSVSAMEILERMMEKRGAKADISMDSRTNQLVAIARPDHHELIRETLDTLRADEPDLEIYDLEYVDPFSAEMAILSEFADEGLNAPQVDLDPITQQLFVRASEEQHQRIRDLLIKMGESKLTLLGDRGTEAMRVIPFHGDLESAIEEIQRVWPTLRDNPIRIVTPSTGLPGSAEPEETKPAEAPPAKPEPEAPPAEPKPEPAAKPEEMKPAETPPAKPEPKPETPPAEPKPEPATKPEETRPAETPPPKPEPKPETPPAEPKPEPAAKVEETKPAETPPTKPEPKPEPKPETPPAEPKPEPAAEPEETKPAETPPAKPEPKPETPPAEAKPEPAAEPKETKPAETEAKAEGEEKDTPAESSPPAADNSDAPSSADSAWDDAWHAFAQIELGSPTAADQAQGQPAPADAPPQEQPKPDEQPPAGEKAESKPDENGLPPVYVVPGEGTVTIVSDDPEALDRFEELLRTLLPSTGRIGRNISIFELKHTSAAVAAEKLEELLESTSPFSWRRSGGSVVIVPDERLNTVLVQGSRVDRETAESLLRILDSDEVPATLAAHKPNLIAIKNVDAEQIAEVVRNVFKSQLTPPTSTSRNRSGRTSTASVRMAPQVAVDEGTNSLVVMAPSPLKEEIAELANTLDEAAGKDPARRVKIIPLEKADPDRVQRALEQIFSNPSSGRRR